MKKKYHSIKIISLLSIICLIVSSCGEVFIPKRYEYFRIELPKAEYSKCEKFNECSFLISKYANITNCDDTWATKYDEWFNINYPKFNSDIHISYKKITPDQFYAVSEDSRALAYKHASRASAINESVYTNDTTKVYGIMYTMSGSSASQIQFFMTDSSEHFLRGSLYFNNIPNADSIAPVAKYIEQDIVKLVESIQWK